MSRLASVLSLIALPLLVALGDEARAQSDCSHYALVSGYHSNVHIYDGCSGAFLRVLDPQPGRLQGAQAVRVGPDGNLWVVSEISAQVHRYRADDFSYVSTPISLGAGFGITGLAFRGGDTVYTGGYTSSTVRTYRLDGQLRATPVAAVAGFRGPDNGLTFGPDGLLYVPGYNTHNVLRHDPATGQNAILVANGSGGLRNARGILFRADGATFLVSSEGSGQILEFRRDNGALVRELARGLARPTGMDWGPDGSLVVATEAGVLRLDPASGTQRGVLVAAGSGGLNGPTFTTFVTKSSGVDRSQVGTQFWISGAGRLDGLRLVVDAMQSTTGPVFGPSYDPAAIVSKRWGRLNVDFSSCTEGRLTWVSSGSDSAGFGDGSYPISRFLPGAATQRCQQVGFAQSPPEDWLQGTWSGGATRNGEGLVFEFFNASTVVVAWFTHRPAAP